jgi:hypothetical protein
MAMMLAKTYAAFKAAGVSEAEAIAAAEEIAAFDQRLAAIETRLAVVTWMIAALFAVVGGIGLSGLWLALRIAAKLGALSA